MVAQATLKAIFDKTEGHCHFCGDPLILTKLGWKDPDDLDGVWEIDHVIQKHKGGAKDASNCLAACVECNRLRWHRTGLVMRDILRLGIIARHEIKKNSSIGKVMLELKEQRLKANLKRRKRVSKERIVYNGEICCENKQLSC